MYNTQRQWLLSNLLEFYQNREYLDIVKKIINREYVIHKSKKLSIRIVNWFVTNYAKQHFTVYEIPSKSSVPKEDPSSIIPVPVVEKSCSESDLKTESDLKKESDLKIESDLKKESHSKTERFFVWTSYKSTEDSYSKQMFDPYCRQDRILIPYDEQTRIETTIGQLHFFKWAILNHVIEYIIEHFDAIDRDMSVRLNTVKRKEPLVQGVNPATNAVENGKTRKKREELSISACRSIRKEFVPIKLTF